MSVGPQRRRARRLAVIGLLAACLALAPGVPLPASASCEGECAAVSRVQIIARSDRSRERDARWLAERQARQERREERNREKRTRSTVRSLERRLDRMERSERRSKKRRRSRGDPAAGSHCMYGLDGKLIHAPAGSRCGATRDAPVEPDTDPPPSPGDRSQRSGVEGSADRSREGQPDAQGSQPTAPAPTRAAATGCVKGSCRNGQGTYTWADGSRYVGGFRNGRQHGQGTLIFADGSSYVGSWRDGQRSGLGTAMFADGRMQAGRWQAGRFTGRSARGAPGLSLTPSWPDLSQPAKSVGGGSLDAAVIVGVEGYAHVPNIPGAKRNAIDWYKYLVKTRGIPVDRVALLLDEDATREEMSWAAEEAARLTGEGGSLWFVFVGHGAPAPNGRDGLLIGFDAQQKARSISSRSLPRAQLLAILEKSEADHINVLLDACFSGQAPGGAPLVAGLQPLVVTSNAPTSDRRITLMTAARSDQYAGPLPGAERPAFSYLILGGLRGWADLDGDGRIAALELDEYVSDAMRALIRDRQQEPTFIGDDAVMLVRSARETGPDLSDMVLGVAMPASASGSP